MNGKEIPITTSDIKNRAVKSVKWIVLAEIVSRSSSPYGLLVFCLARLGMGIASMSLHFFVANKILNLPFTYLKNYIKSPLLASLPMIAIIYGGVNLFDPFDGWLKFAFVLLLGAGSYIAAMWALDRKFTQQIIRLIKKAML